MTFFFWYTNAFFLRTFQEHFAGLFPRDSPKNTRFSINFFTSIGLGGLTDELREHLKNIPKNFELNIGTAKESSSSSSSDSSSESSGDEDSAGKMSVKLNYIGSGTKSINCFEMDLVI